MTQEYFSDRETGPKPRIKEEISLSVWGGIYALYSRMNGNESFGKSFPKLCHQGSNCGCDKDLFIKALIAEIPNIEWPLTADKTPELFTILDFIEFCYKYAAKPSLSGYHPIHQTFANLLSAAASLDYLFGEEPEQGHNHYTYRIEEGQKEFREAINLLFARNEIIYELSETGSIIRLAPEIIRDKLQLTVFKTGDSRLDEILNIARIKYLDRDIEVRKESLEKLWDAWERLKTLESDDKKRSIAILLEKTSPEQNFRERLDKEGKELTEIGNKFQIRHSEVDKIPIESSDHVDYLFHRLFALVYLILKATDRIR